MPMRCEGEHWEKNEDGRQLLHKGYTNLPCPKCGVDYLVSNEMRHLRKNCGREKCNG